MGARRVRPPQLVSASKLHMFQWKLHSQLIASLSFFMAKTFTVFDAGLALKTHGSLVKGLTPFRAGVAGFFFSFMFSIPANLKDPVFFNSSDATPMMPSTMPFTCFCFK